MTYRVSGLIVASGGGLVMTPSGELVRGRNVLRPQARLPTGKEGRARGLRQCPQSGRGVGQWLISSEGFKAASTRADTI